ncbi:MULTISPECIES: hypothetical protein [unclassified Microcoleus]|uniref:hypothetical protein n=1 Tax=unclassified Microcoleus TaxID=2642155 RepID=UPI0025D7A7B8|nr:MULTISPECIES: hypothetical protein [unclassified Microcoleus]
MIHCFNPLRSTEEIAVNCQLSTVNCQLSTDERLSFTINPPSQILILCQLMNWSAGESSSVSPEPSSISHERRSLIDRATLENSSSIIANLPLLC